MAAGKIEILVQTEVKKSIANMQKQIDSQTKVGKSVKTLGSAFKGLASAAAVVFAVKKVVDFTKANQDLADVQEASNTKLNAVLKATKGVAGLTSAELQDMASSFQDITTYGDEVTMSAQATMLTFREIGEEVFPRAMMASMDMAEIFGSLESANLGLGKALNDPIAGITALSRVGVTFSDTQKEQIKLFQDTGDIASAQNIILSELENQFGGTAIAMAQTAKGVRTQLSNEFGDIQESLGEGWNKISTPSNKKLLEFVKENKQMITGIFSNMPEIAGLAFDSAKSIIKKFISWEGISSLGLTLYESFQISTSALPELLFQAVKFATAPMRNFTSWIGEIFNSVWVKVKNGFIETLQDIPIVGDTLFGHMQKQAEEVPKSFGEAWDDTVTEMAESGVAFKDKIVDAYSQIGKVMMDNAGETYGAEIDAFKSGVEEIISASEKAKAAKDALDSTGGGAADEANVLSFAQGLHSQILQLEEERVIAKQNLAIIQELIVNAEKDGVAVGSSQMEIYLAEEKKLKDILGLKEEELEKAGELEERFKGTWDVENLTSFGKAMLKLVAFTDKLKEKVEEYAGIFDAVKGAYDAWDSYSSSVFNKEMNRLETRLETLKEINTAVLEANDEMYSSEIDALNENFDNDLLSREEYMSKKAVLDAKKEALDKKATEKADQLEKEITRRKNEEAKKRFDIDKASSMASAVVAGALAVIQAITLGPIAGPIAAVLIGAASAVQIGMIAAEQFVPQYADGTGNVQRDHMALIHQGEGIIPKTFNDALKSGEYSLSGGGRSNTGGNSYNFYFTGDIYGGDETTERIFEGIEMAQDSGVLPAWQHIA